MDRPVIDLPIDQLHPAPWNPNEQSDETFNQLVQTIREVGFIQPLVVARVGEDSYEIIAGEHRWRAARHLNYTVVPCVILEGFDEDRRKFLNVRMNVVTGKISPAKFTQLVMQLRRRYSDEIMSAMMGFNSEEEMKRLVKKVADGLPPDMRRHLQKSQKEIKNVKDLNDVLNRLMRDHGSTLQHGFIFFVHSGQTHLMIQMDPGLKRILEAVGDRCVRERLEIADVLTAHLVRMEVAQSRAESPEKISS